MVGRPHYGANAKAITGDDWSLLHLAQRLNSNVVWLDQGYFTPARVDLDKSANSLMQSSEDRESITIVLPSLCGSNFWHHLIYMVLNRCISRGMHN